MCRLPTASRWGRAANACQRGAGPGQAAASLWGSAGGERENTAFLMLSPHTPHFLRPTQRHCSTRRVRARDALEHSPRAECGGQQRYGGAEGGGAELCIPAPSPNPRSIRGRVCPLAPAAAPHSTALREGPGLRAAGRAGAGAEPTDTAVRMCLSLPGQTKGTAAFQRCLWADTGFLRCFGHVAKREARFSAVACSPQQQ